MRRTTFLLLAAGVLAVLCVAAAVLWVIPHDYFALPVRRVAETDPAARLHFAFECNDTRERPGGFGRGGLRPVHVRVSVNGRVVVDELHEASANNNFNFSLTLPEAVNRVEIEVPGETGCSFPVYNDKPTWARILFWYGRYDWKGNPKPNPRPSMTYTLSNRAMPTF